MFDLSCFMFDPKPLLHDVLHPGRPPLVDGKLPTIPGGCSRPSHLMAVLGLGPRGVCVCVGGRATGRGGEGPRVAE